MKRRSWILRLTMSIFAALAVFLWWSGELATWFAPTMTRAIDAPTSAGRIVTAPNVHVSSPRTSNPHYGCTIAADPSRPERLFIASMHVPNEGTFGIVGYSSHDGGATWELGCERTGRTPDERCCDEAIAFGPDGDLILAHMRGDYGNDAVGVGHARVDMLRSTDGGITWEERGGIDHYVDRPQLAFDLTNGSHRGRLYCNANIVQWTPAPNRRDAMIENSRRAAVYVFNEARAGEPQSPLRIPDRELLTSHNSNPVVLADGTVVVSFERSTQAVGTPHRITVWRSSDGGQTFIEAAPVPTKWRHATVRAQGFLASMYPRLAAAPEGSSSAGQLCCVWDDGPFILFSSSSDRGDTWTAPILLSEQPLDTDRDGQYYAAMPAIAINNRGDIAVVWYDRRGLPPATVDAAGRIFKSGYNIRCRVSTDGGRTWLPSVQINERPGRGDPLDVRFWGLSIAADAEGRFHPAWVSDCGGVLQIWTAAVTLEQQR